MIKKILIGVDDSEYAENATKYGFKLAESLNAGVGIVHMIEPMPIPVSGSGADEILGANMQSITGVDLDVLDAQTQISENILQRTAKKYGGKLQITQFNEYGTTGEGIIKCAVEFKADIIVVGNHQRSGFDRLFGNDVAEYVVKHSPIPVLVVPSSGD